MKHQKLLSIALLINTPAVYAAVLNDTGIKTCSNATQNGLPCPVAGFPRQDAENGTNKFDFTKLDANGNPMSVTATNHSCVKDNITGLIWEIKTFDNSLHYAGKSYTFYEAAQFATAVNEVGWCGFKDWRVPNVKELVGIVHYGISSPGAKIDTDYFTESWGAPFWTSSLYAPNTTASWAVFFCYGWTGNKPRDTKLYVRLVRGQQSLPSFSDSGNGIVVDNSTGLMWAKCSNGQTGNACTGNATTTSWSQSLAIAVASRLGGYSDWRLPNIKELQSLADYSTYYPSINLYFPNTYSNWYWSSSTDANDSSKVWIVPFYNGQIYNDNRNSINNIVRLVRSGEAVVSKPDFTITVMTIAPVAPTANGTFTATITVKNQGTAAGDGKFLDVWSHQTAVKGCGTVGNKRVAVGTIAVGASKVLTVTGLPAGIAGSKMLRAFVDIGCGTVESNEANNQRTALYSVNQATGINFAATSITLNPVTPYANGTFNAVVQVKNLGTVAGDGKLLAVWSHQPAVQVCNAAGVSKSLAVGVLAAGASKNITFTGLPAGVAGSKMLRAFVDSGCGTGENNEANNQLTKTYTVQ